MLPGVLMSCRDHQHQAASMQFVQSCDLPGGPCHSPIMRSAAPRSVGSLLPAHSRTAVGAKGHASQRIIHHDK